MKRINILVTSLSHSNNTLSHLNRTLSLFHNNLWTVIKLVNQFNQNPSQLLYLKNKYNKRF